MEHNKSLLVSELDEQLVSRQFKPLHETKQLCISVCLQLHSELMV